MAFAATLLPSGSVRSVMDSTTRGLARAGSFTSSDTCSHANTQRDSFEGSKCETQDRWGKSNSSSGDKDYLDFVEQLFQSSLISASANTFPRIAPHPPCSLLTIVKGMNCRMLPRLPCSRHSTHSSMKLCTNWVWGPAILEPTMDETSRNKLAEGNMREAASEHLHGAREHRFISLSRRWGRLWSQTVGSNDQTVSSEAAVPFYALNVT